MEAVYCSKCIQIIIDYYKYTKLKFIHGLLHIKKSTQPYNPESTYEFPNDEHEKLLSIRSFFFSC